MANIILINPDYYEDIFSVSKARSAICRGTTPLSLACIGASLLRAGHNVRVLDLNLADDPYGFLQRSIREFRPQFAGITATTPLIKKAYRIAEVVKNTNKEIFVIGGGAHASALPEEVLAESLMDCVVKGEGDAVISEIVENGVSPGISNIFYREKGRIISSGSQEAFIQDLDNLPFPAYELFDIKKYRQPRIMSRKAPLGYIETSRGCYGRCIFCNKNIHGWRMRMKSPLRVVDEMERMLELGFREIQIIDDVFTADMKRARVICEEILKRGLRFPWYPRGGIRVDRVNLELLKIMKKAGCYRIPFGIESGSQRIIDLVDKKISLGQAEEAVQAAKKAGLETECYFMLGLPTEKEKDLKSSIDFSIKLDPDYAKFAITIPLPGTRMFDDMWGKGQIKTRDWDKYNFAIPPKELYDHDTLSWDQIGKYYDISYRKFYFRIRYILKMVFKSIFKGNFFAHVKAFFKTRW